MTPDVLVVGGGNAGLCAAISARLAGARVLLLERAERAVRGGNSKFVRNVRCASEGSGGYGTAEFEADLAAVGGDAAVTPLASMVIRESGTLVPWMEEQGVRWQSAMRGTIGLDRTNRFFLGGGKALVNRYHRRAEELGVEVRYGIRAERVVLAGGRFRAVVATAPEGEVAIPAAAAVVASGGFEADLEWLARSWGPGARNYAVRGSPTNDGRVLASLLDAGIASEGNPRGFHAVAVDARGPRFDGGIVTRVDAIPWGIVVNRDARRFADEGQDLWPKRYASWGQLIARQRDQLAYAICDSRAYGRFIPPAFAAHRADSIPELAARLELDGDRLARTVREFNAAAPPARGGCDTSRLDGVSTNGLAPPKRNWAVPIDAPPYYGYPMRPGVTFTYLGVRVDEAARAVTASGDTVDNLFAAGEIMAGNILHEGYLAGFGMTIGTVVGRLAGTGAARLARR